MSSKADVRSADLIREGNVPTRDGDVKVKTISLAGLFQCLAIVKEAKLEIPPESLRLDWITNQTVGADGTVNLDKAQEIFAANVQARQKAIMGWLFTSPSLITAILKAVTGKTDEQVAEIAAPDALLILAKALSLLDIAQTMELASGFFSDLGGLMDGLKRLQGQPQTSAPDADKAAEPSKG